MPPLSRGAAVAGLYAAFAVIFTWPTAGGLGETTLLGVSSPFDALIYRWNFFALRDALASGTSPFHSELLYYPERVPLALYTPTYLYAALSLPIQWLWPGFGGLDAAYQFCVLLSFTLAGVASYALARAQGLDTLGAFIAGVAFAYCAARMTNLARLNVLGSEAIPLALLGLQWSLERRHWKGPLLLAAALVALAFNSASHLATAGIGLAVFGAANLPRRSPGAALRIGVAAAATLALIWPLVPGALEAAEWAALGSESEGASRAERVRFSLDLLSLVWPNAEDLWLGRVWPRPTNYLESYFSFFPGIIWISLALAGVILRAQLSRGLPWLAVGGVGAVLALGPEAKLLEQPLGISLPYAWLEGLLPPLRVTRVPARFVTLASLAMALWAGASWMALRARLRLSRAGRLRLAAAVALLLAYDGTEGWPLTRMLPVEPRFDALAEGLRQTTAPGISPAILDLPFDTHHTRRLAMAHVPGHGRPILFADYPRAPGSNRQHFASSRLFQLLSDPQRSADELAAALGELDLAKERAALRELGIGTLVLHHGFFLRVVGPQDPVIREALGRGSVISILLTRSGAQRREFDLGSYRAVVLDL